LQATAGRVDQQLHVVSFDDPAAAEAALTDESVDALLPVPADLSSSGTLRFKEDPDQAITQIASGAVVALRVLTRDPS